jgi:hypothetical protein
MLARLERRLVTFAVAFVALGILLGAYLYLSAVLLESDCFLAGDRICAVALGRVWTAAAIAGGSVLLGLGLAAAMFARRAKRARRSGGLSGG